jgi:plastocyanin
MSSRPVVALVVAALLALAACGPDGGASPALPAAAPSASVSTIVLFCRQTADPGVVKVSIADFEFKPASITAKVGEVIAFSNIGFEPHNATVWPGCQTRTLQTGESDGIVFSAVGSTRFGCTVHPWMTGTLTITG